MTDRHALFVEWIVEQARSANVILRGEVDAKGDPTNRLLIEVSYPNTVTLSVVVPPPPDDWVPS